MKFKFTKKTIIIIVLIAVVGTIGVLYIQNKNAAQKEQDALAATQNNTVPVTLRDIESTIYASGNIKAKESATILADTSGIVSEILVEAGDVVEKNQVIASLAAKDLLDQIEQKELTFKIDKNNYIQAKLNAEDALEDAKKSYEEKKALYAVDSVSLNELDKAKEAYEDAQKELDINVDDSVPTSLEIKYLQYKQSELTLNNLYQDLAAASIKSPIAGVITSVNIEETSYVNSKAKLFEVAVLNELEISTTVGEYEVNKLEVGMEAKITGDAFDKIYTGIVSNIAASATKSGSETVVEITIDITDETDELKPNFTANADIVIGSVEGALAVPLDAIISTQKGKAVRVKDGEAFKMVQVETGVANDLFIEIISDQIKEGDEVASASNIGAAAARQGGMMPGTGGGKGPGGR